mgnify:CR=1 FL=1
MGLLEKIILFAIPVIFAITLHEAAHGYVAKYFGDLTAYAQGRVSLNPLRHIDPIGTILVPLIFLLLPGNFLFGWAKPVPVNFNALRDPRKDMLWVAAAGPGANLLMVIVWALVLKFSSVDGEQGALHVMALAGIMINLVLMFLNLLPILPLDGGRVASSLLPESVAQSYAKSEPYGIVIVILLLVTGILGRILTPLIESSLGILLKLFSITTGLS